MNIIRHNPQKILSDASEFGNLVFTGGQMAEDLDQGVRGQTEQVLKAIDALLAKAGSSKSRILSVNVWLTDIRNRNEMNQAWSA